MRDPADLAEVRALSAFLLDQINSHHQNDPAGILLANLGWAVINTRPELKHLLNRFKLGRFIDRELRDKVEIVSSATKPGEMRVVPRPVSADSLPARGMGDASAGSAEIRRPYSRAVLLAFTRRIPDGCSRVLHLDPTVFFEDVPSTALDRAAATFLIDSRFLVDAEIPLSRAHAQEMDARVDAWLAETGASLERLLQQRKRSPATRAPQSSSLFDALVSALSPTELRRVQLPLDIVEKLKSLQR